MPMLIPVAYAAVVAYVTIAVTVALTAFSFYQQKKNKKKARDDYNKSLSDRLVMVATAESARSIVLGRVRTVDGVVFKGTWGSKSENMTLVIALAGHEIDAIEQIYFGDIPVSLDGSGLVLTPPYGVIRRETATHQVASGGGPQTVTLPNVPTSIIAVTYQGMGDAPGLAYTWTPGSTSVSFNSTGITGTIYISYMGSIQYSAARVSQFLGGAGQDLSVALSSRFPSLITSAHKFKGFAGLIVDMIYTQDSYPSGVPAITARIRGANDLYDPRTGVGGWSENPAICARYIAKHPWAGAAHEDEVDDAAVIAAANACDITHTYTDSAGSSTTRAMYTCAYVATTEASPETHLNELVEAMAGKWGWAGGQLRMRAGVYTAPVTTITDDWLGPGQRQINPGPGMADLVNIITPTIADAAQHHVGTPIAPVRAEAYIAADGMELPSETTLSAVDFAPQAQHICAISLREMRQGMTLSWPVNMRGFVLELFDNVLLDSPRYGFVNKPFEVLGWSFNLEGGIQLMLRETGASIYQPDDEFPANDPEPNTALPLPWVVPTIQNLRAFSGTAELLLQDDGTVRTRVRVAFNAITDQAVLSGGRIEVQYRLPSAGGWQTQTFSGDESPLFLEAMQDGLIYIIRAKAHNALCGGDWSNTIAHKVVGKTERPPTPDNFLIEAMPDGTRLLKGGYSAATKPVDFAGYRVRYRQGSGPYAWTDMLPFQTDDGFFTTLPIETNLLMAGTYTLAMVGVDTTGNESAVPVFIVALLPNPRLGDAVAYHQLDAEGWPGSLTDCVIELDNGAPILRARDQAVWDDWSGSWDTYTRWVWDPVPAWTYVVATEDFGSPVAVLPVISFEGAGSVAIEEQHSDDGMAWSTWALVAGAVTARYVSIRATVSAEGSTGPGVTQVTFIRSMSVIYTGSASIESVNDLDPSTLPGGQRLGAGNYLLPTSRSFIKVTELSVALQGVGGNWSWSVVAGERDEKHINVFNGGSLADPPLIDYTVRGISL